MSCSRNDCDTLEEVIKGVLFYILLQNMASSDMHIGGAMKDGGLQPDLIFACLDMLFPNCRDFFSIHGWLFRIELVGYVHIVSIHVCLHLLELYIRGYW